MYTLNWAACADDVEKEKFVGKPFSIGQVLPWYSHALDDVKGKIETHKN